MFTPAGVRARNLPVMVWVHGGALRTGESDDYNPAGLVRRGVVVTINYRIGALGFLADAALASRLGGPSGDDGLMDQQAALRWVQRDIRGFGGNPGDVTLFGESAGGLSTLAQLVSPGARGLFQRAIVESGTYQLTQQPLATAESAGQAFAAKIGCASDHPGRFDVRRSPNPTSATAALSTHYCLGSSLAKLETELIFNALVGAMPGIRRTGDPVRLRSGWINGIKHLPVSYRG